MVLSTILTDTRRIPKLPQFDLNARFVIHTELLWKLKRTYVPWPSNFSI